MARSDAMKLVLVLGEAGHGKWYTCKTLAAAGYIPIICDKADFALRIGEPVLK